MVLAPLSQFLGATRREQDHYEEFPSELMYRTITELNNSHAYPANLSQKVQKLQQNPTHLDQLLTDFKDNKCVYTHKKSNKDRENALQATLCGICLMALFTQVLGFDRVTSGAMAITLAYMYKQLV